MGSHCALSENKLISYSSFAQYHRYRTRDWSIITSMVSIISMISSPTKRRTHRHCQYLLIGQTGGITCRLSTTSNDWKVLIALNTSYSLLDNSIFTQWDPVQINNPEDVRRNFNLSSPIRAWPIYHCNCCHSQKLFSCGIAIWCDLCDSESCFIAFQCYFPVITI